MSGVDRSLPPVDRDESGTTQRGPALVRRALGDASPLPMPWPEQIAEIARSNGWAVHRCGQGGFPMLFLARRGRFVIVDTGHHRGFQADRWRHEFGLLPLIEQRTWQPADVDAVRAELA